MLPRDMSPPLSPHDMSIHPQLPHLLACVAMGAGPLGGAPAPAHDMLHAAAPSSAVGSDPYPALPPCASHVHEHAARARAGASEISSAEHPGATCVSLISSAPHARPLRVETLATSPSGTRARAGASATRSAEHPGATCVSLTSSAPHARPLRTGGLATPPSGTRARAGASATSSADHFVPACVSLIRSATTAGIPGVATPVASSPSGTINSAKAHVTNTEHSDLACVSVSRAAEHLGLSGVRVLGAATPPGPAELACVSVPHAAVHTASRPHVISCSHVHGPGPGADSTRSMQRGEAAGAASRAPEARRSAADDAAVSGGGGRRGGRRKRASLLHGSRLHTPRCRPPHLCCPDDREQARRRDYAIYMYRTSPRVAC